MALAWACFVASSGRPSLVGLSPLGSLPERFQLGQLSSPMVFARLTPVSALWLVLVVVPLRSERPAPLNLWFLPLPRFQNPGSKGPVVSGLLGFARPFLVFLPAVLKQVLSNPLLPRGGLLLLIVGRVYVAQKVPFLAPGCPFPSFPRWLAMAMAILRFLLLLLRSWSRPASLLPGCSGVATIMSAPPVLLPGYPLGWLSAKWLPWLWCLSNFRRLSLTKKL